VALPAGYKPEHVAPALARKAQTLPQALKRSLTRYQGPEMRDWKHMHVDAGIDVFLCDPARPGSAAPTRTRTGCSGSTSPRASTSPRSPKPSSTPSPTNSTSGHANASTSRPRRSSSPSCRCKNRLTTQL
jgi:hypothetical protein